VPEASPGLPSRVAQRRKVLAAHTGERVARCGTNLFLIFPLAFICVIATIRVKTSVVFRMRNLDQWCRYFSEAERRAFRRAIDALGANSLQRSSRTPVAGSPDLAGPKSWFVFHPHRETQISPFPCWIAKDSDENPPRNTQPLTANTVDARG
jgi:hypothetical protein